MQVKNIIIRMEKEAKSIRGIRFAKTNNCIHSKNEKIVGYINVQIPTVWIVYL